MTAHPQEPPTSHRPAGPLGSVLNRIPLQSRFALTAGVVVGIVASVIAGGLEEVAGQIALGVGIGVGIIVAIALAIRPSTDRVH